ncbi:unnamed protein product, partial [Mesorhabditis spiculigera]
MSSRQPTRRSDADGPRGNSRMFAFMRQSTGPESGVGGGGGGGGARGRGGAVNNSTPIAHNTRSGQGRRQQAAPAEKVEELHDVDEIIAQFSDLTVRGNRSAQQIKANLAACKYLEEMDEDEWMQLSGELVQVAFDEAETDFIVDVIGTLLKHQLFCDVMRAELAQVSASYIMGGKTDHSVPKLFGTLLCATWPRGATRDTEASNPVLFMTMQIVQGWLIVLEQSEQEPIKTHENTQKRDFDHLKDEEASGSEDDGEQEVVVEAEPAEGESASPEIVESCARAVCCIVTTQKRSLWLKWPTLFDQIYQAIRPLITHSKVLSCDTKAELLNTLLILTKSTERRA